MRALLRTRQIALQSTWGQRPPRATRHYAWGREEDPENKTTPAPRAALSHSEPPLPISDWAPVDLTKPRRESVKDPVASTSTSDPSRSPFIPVSDTPSASSFASSSRLPPDPSIPRYGPATAQYDDPLSVASTSHSADTAEFFRSSYPASNEDASAAEPQTVDVASDWDVALNSEEDIAKEAAQYLTDDEKIAAVRRLLALRNPERDPRHHDMVWAAYHTISVAERRALPPDILHHVLSQVVPYYKVRLAPPIATRGRRQKRFEKVSDVWSQRMSTVVNDLRHVEAGALADDSPLLRFYLFAMRQLAHLGGIEEVNAIHREIKQFKIPSPRHRETEYAKRLVFSRLRALAQYLSEANKTVREVPPARQEDIISSLWSILGSYETFRLRDSTDAGGDPSTSSVSLQPDSQELDLLVSCATLAQACISKDAVPLIAALDKISERLFYEVYGLNMQYLVIEEFRPRIPLSSRVFGTLLEYVRRKHGVWRMIATYEVLSQPGVSPQYILSPEEENDDFGPTLSEAIKREEEASKGLDWAGRPRRSAANTASNPTSSYATSEAHTSDQLSQPPGGIETVPDPSPESYEVQEVYPLGFDNQPRYFLDFHPLGPRPFDMLKDLVAKSARSGGSDSDRDGQFIASDAVFASMMDECWAQWDLEAAGFVVKAWAFEAAQQQVHYLEQTMRTMRTAATIESDEERYAHVRFKLPPPRTTLNGTVMDRLHWLMRKLSQGNWTEGPRGTDTLPSGRSCGVLYRTFNPLLQDVAERMRQEYLILTGQEPPTIRLDREGKVIEMIPSSTTEPFYIIFDGEAQEPLFATVKPRPPREGIRKRGQSASAHLFHLATAQTMIFDLAYASEVQQNKRREHRRKVQALKSARQREDAEKERGETTDWGEVRWGIKRPGDVEGRAEEGEGHGVGHDSGEGEHERANRGYGEHGAGGGYDAGINERLLTLRQGEWSHAR